MNKNTLIILAVGVGAYLLWKKSQETKGEGMSSACGCGH